MHTGAERSIVCGRLRPGKRAARLTRGAWNNVLVDKFERFRNILLDGLSYHSEGPLGSLAIVQGVRAWAVSARKPAA